MGVKISELQEKTTISNTDIIPVVDNTEGTRKMQLKLLRKNINFLSVTSTSNQKVYNITAWADSTVELDKVQNSYGEGLELSNNGIKIGAGINLVNVSGIMKFYTTPADGINIYAKIYRNDSTILSTDIYKPSAGSTESLFLPSLRLNVSEGDIITIRFTSGTAGQYTVIQSAGNTFLQVQVVD